MSKKYRQKRVTAAFDSSQLFKCYVNWAGGGRGFTVSFGTPCIYYMLRSRLYLGLGILVCLYQ